MPALIFLEVDSSPVSGTLPEEWGSPSVFNQLGGLKLTNCSISGDPAVLEMVCCMYVIRIIDSSAKLSALATGQTLTTYAGATDL